jgi:hypothetical protein
MDDSDDVAIRGDRTIQSRRHGDVPHILVDAVTCQSEIEQLRSRLRDHHVSRLQIAMNDPLSVHFVEGVADLDSVAKNVVNP